MTEQPIERKLMGVAQCGAAMDELVSRCTRSLDIFERQLDRGFNGLRRCELLRAFLRADKRNRLRIVLHETGNLARDCARLLELQRQFAHCVAIHETQSEARSVHDPFSVADERDHLHRFHYDRMRGVLRLDCPVDTRVFVERFEEIWSFSAPSVNATTLGL